MSFVCYLLSIATQGVIKNNLLTSILQGKVVITRSSVVEKLSPEYIEEGHVEILSSEELNFSMFRYFGLLNVIV